LLSIKIYFYILKMINKGKKRAILGIYDRIKSQPVQMAPLPVLLHGASDSHILHKPTDRIINSRLARIKTSIEVLKLSAAYSGSYSISAN